MKRADHVFSRRYVDADFAPDRSVDLREQGRGYLDEGEAAQIAGRRKTGQVTYHAAAQRNHYVTSLQTFVAEEGDRLLVRTHRFVRLALFHQPHPRIKT